MIDAIFEFFFDHPLVLVALIALIIGINSTNRQNERDKRERNDRARSSNLRGQIVDKKYYDRQDQRDSANASDEKTGNIAALVLFAIVIYGLYRFFTS